MEDARGNIVVVEDDTAQRTILARWLASAGHEVTEYPDGESCLRGLAASIPDVVCLDLQLPGMNGLEVLDRIRAHNPRLPVIMLTVDDSTEPVVAAIRLGAFEYLRKPADRQKLLTTVRNAVVHSQMEVRLAQLQHEVEGWNYPDILGQSEAMRDLFRQMDRVAPTDVSVLIHGESGTGKELVARALHETSGRSDEAFVALNCAAIPESLQESELFGHERGAFTGASQRRPGRFEQADGGTLFLDEIAELTPSLQAKLLRAIQEQRFYRVGGTVEVSSDFRLVAATHRNLAEEVRAGRFREDLFFRLAVLELAVPPLRDRGPDVVLLAETFASDMGLEMRGSPAELSDVAKAALVSYEWPGNVRELQNAMQRAVVLASGGVIGLDALPDAVRAHSPPERTGEPGGAFAAPQTDPGGGSWTRTMPDLSLEQVEKEVIRTLVERHSGNLSAVARILDVSRTTLYRKMGAHGIARPSS